MSLKSILFAGSAFAALIASAMPASADSYWRYDDQAGETRQLNLMAFEEARLQRVNDDGDDDEWGWTDGDDDDDDADADELFFSPWPHDDGDDDDDDGDDGDDD